MKATANNSELLAPVGDLERLSAVLQYGADAVYLGRPEYSMRAAANYFQTEDALAEAVTRTHHHGKRIYLTCNTLPRNAEIERFPQFLQEAKETGIDALILADMGLLQIVQKLAPDMEIHMSTQTGIVNYATCQFLYNMGVKRAVLARELSLDEIAEIRAKIPRDMELEAFVHGAMCMSFSGRCMLSAYLTGRDANRGACAQPCRWKYHIMEETRPGHFFPVEETGEGTFLFNAKDLCMIDHIPELLQAGVNSLKLEGRNKSTYYVSIITNAYRAAMDAAISHQPLPEWAMREVYQVSHREYCTGFFYQKKDATQRYESSNYVHLCDVAAIVDRWEKNRLYLKQRNRFFVGDKLEIIQPGMPPTVIFAKDLQDENGQSIEMANHAMMSCSIACETAFPTGSMLRCEVK